MKFIIIIPVLLLAISCIKPVDTSPRIYPADMDADYCLDLKSDLRSNKPIARLVKKYRDLEPALLNIPEKQYLECDFIGHDEYYYFYFFEKEHNWFFPMSSYFYGFIDGGHGKMRWEISPIVQIDFPESEIIDFINFDGENHKKEDLLQFENKIIDVEIYKNFSCPPDLDTTLSIIFRAKITGECAYSPFASSPIPEYDNWSQPPWNIGATYKDSVFAEPSSDGTLVIRGKGKMMDFIAKNTRPWYLKCKRKNTKVVIENGVTNIGNEVFADCDITSITIPSSVTFIGNYVCSYGLTSIDIPSGVTSFGDYAFSDCGSLEAIDVASDNKAYSSMDGILYDKNFSTLIQCPQMKRGTVTIPDGVTSIEERAFSYSYLTSVVIPSSVTSIGKKAFEYCQYMKSITILNFTPPSLYDDYYGTDYQMSTAFEGVNKDTCTLYVPKGSVDAYRKAKGWAYFKNIKPIE